MSSDVKRTELQWADLSRDELSNFTLLRLDMSFFRDIQQRGSEVNDWGLSFGQ